MNNYPTIDMAATGNRIRDLRKEHHIKVDDIVSFMGFESQQAVYKWQRGESLPSVDNLYALSRLFGTTIDDILVGCEEEGGDSPSSVIMMEIYNLFRVLFIDHSVCRCIWSFPSPLSG